MSMITIIGRGHSGTRAMSHTLAASGVYMGSRLNASGDLLPPKNLYKACRVMGRHVVHLGGMNWDFSCLHTMPIDPSFVRLVETYLTTVLESSAEHKGWKIPETTLIYPWIVRMFPDIKYVHWVRDPRDVILVKHLTDNMAYFGAPCPWSWNKYLRRAISWKYQREIVKATPPPRHTITIRFEDFVLEQDKTLAKLESFLGFPLARIPVKAEAVGRWRIRQAGCDLSFLEDDLLELGYV